MKNKILVLNPDNASYEPLLKDLGGEITRNSAAFVLNPKDFKLIQFTGGEDVAPKLYGDTSPKNYCMSGNRDEEEIKIFKIAVKSNIPMVGICRGIQFLNVMCGGKLIHHLDGHASSQHIVNTSSSSLSFTTFKTNSLHHQMCVPPTDGHIMAWSLEKHSKRYIGDKDEDINWPGPEVEGVFIPWDKVIGVQWHPEMMITNSIGRNYYKTMVSDFLKMDITTFRSKYISADSIKVRDING